MAIFTRRSILGEQLRIYGDGTQTRDLLYAADCARSCATPWRETPPTSRILNAGRA